MRPSAPAAPLQDSPAICQRLSLLWSRAAKEQLRSLTLVPATSSALGVTLAASAWTELSVLFAGWLLVGVCFSDTFWFQRMSLRLLLAWSRMPQMRCDGVALVPGARDCRYRRCAGLQVRS